MTSTIIRIRRQSLRTMFLLVLIGLFNNDGSLAFHNNNVAKSSRRSIRLISERQQRPVPSSLSMAIDPLKNMNAKRKREIEIRRKIMKLKKGGKLQKDDDGDYIRKYEEDDDDDDDDDDEGAVLRKLRARSDNMRNNPVLDQYSDQIKAKMKAYDGLDFGNDSVPEPEEKIKEEPPTSNRRRQATLGSLPPPPSSDDDQSGYTKAEQENEDDSNNNFEEINILNRANAMNKAILGSDADEDDADELTELTMSEKDLVDLVAEKMKEQRRAEEEERNKELEQKQAARRKEREAAAEAVLREEQEQKLATGKNEDLMTKALKYKKLNDEKKSKAYGDRNKVEATTGIGGAYKKNETAMQETYKPKTGSWGYFERPKDISKAYGGGRKIVIDEDRMKEQRERTRAKLRQYERNQGIDASMEKEHEQDINEGLAICAQAMARGMYPTAVSALEKVKGYCSSNSQLGGKVYLELAMAHEAQGNSQEAISLYKTLTKSNIEEIKSNAKRLLSGAEAMTFMRDVAKVPEFQRQKQAETFIDTTFFTEKAFTSNFDDGVYARGYVDKEKLKKENAKIVRSSREARRVILASMGPKEDYSREKIINALRYISNDFDDELKKEMKERERRRVEGLLEGEDDDMEEVIMVVNGKPRKYKRPKRKEPVPQYDALDYKLASPEQMIENLQGEWRVQFLADNKGDGVNFGYNRTVSWQSIESSTTSDDSVMKFQSCGPYELSKLYRQSGNVNFDNELRVLSRGNITSTKGGGSTNQFEGFLSTIFSGRGTASGDESKNIPQQVMLVDSTLLITRNYDPSGKDQQQQKKTVQDMNTDNTKTIDIWSKGDNIESYFAVWRRVEDGTYSNQSNNINK